MIFGQFIEHFVDIACFAPIVNTRGPIFVHPEGIVKRSTYYVFKLYTNELEGYVIPVAVKSEILSHGNKSVDVLDVVLLANADRSSYVYAIVNKDPEKSHTIDLDFDGLGLKTPRGVKGEVLSGNSPDDYNDIGRENVVPRQQTFTVKDGAVTLPPHSLVLLRL